MSARALLLATLGALLIPGCGDSTGSNGGETGPVGGDGAVNDAPVTIIDSGIIVGGDGGPWTCYVIQCDNHTAECGDCMDNDGDGEIDSHDHECLGPCDNTEGESLNGGVGGETGGPCKADCYFDWGNGSGNDQCYWDHRCDPLAVPPDYPPEGIACAYDPARVGGPDCPDVQGMTCLDYCRPLTPNGCDCFGCCAFEELATAGPGGTQGYVWLGALDSNGDGTCTYAMITDTTACPPCTPVGSCYNDCQPCEVCIGFPPPPPDCFDDAGMSGQCPGGEQPCGLPGQPECPMDYYCISGCCQYQIP